MKSYRVGVFTHRGYRTRVHLAAYTRYLKPTDRGCCLHVVQAETSQAAITQALAEHRAQHLGERRL